MRSRAANSAGILTAINSAIDPATRAVTLQATIDNAQHVLRAGMFARVEVLLPETKSTLFVPALGHLVCAVREFRLRDRIEEG